MTSFPEMMFYAEAEGLLPTKEGKINAIIKWLKAQKGDTMFFQDFYDLCLDDYDLDLEDISTDEFHRIQKESGVNIVVY